MQRAPRQQPGLGGTRMLPRRHSPGCRPSQRTVRRGTLCRLGRLTSSTPPRSFAGQIRAKDRRSCTANRPRSAVGPARPRLSRRAGRQNAVSASTLSWSRSGTLAVLWNTARPHLAASDGRPEPTLPLPQTGGREPPPRPGGRGWFAIVPLAGPRCQQGELAGHDSRAARRFGCLGRGDSSCPGSLGRQAASWNRCDLVGAAG